DGIDERLADPPAPVVVVDDLPTERHHGWKFIAFGPDGRLYVPIGAPCNVCDEEGYALILRMNPDGSAREVFARGVRNTVGFDWDPETGELWFTDNGRDMLGDDLPDDELNHAPETGLHFGFPYCHAGSILDPQFGKGRRCEDYGAPEPRLGPPVAALGRRLYDGDMFPARSRGGIFIAQHGSWNRSSKLGYRVMFAAREGSAFSLEPLAEGWLEGEASFGRPVDVEIMPDGALLVSDDQAGVIYRIVHEGLRHFLMHGLSMKRMFESPIRQSLYQLVTVSRIVLTTLFYVIMHMLRLSNVTYGSLSRVT